MRRLLVGAALLLCGSGCSPEQSSAPESEAASANAPAAPASPPPASPSSAPAEAPPATADILTLEGLGALRIGEPVPAGSGWAERGAQASDTCRTVTSRDFPGVYAIVEDGLVRRVTIGERSDVTLAEGIGVGASEVEVRAAFPGLREAPHEYSDPPAKYLTAPDGGDPAMRFEIDSDRTVGLIHAGTMPVLGYVEGCA